MLWRLVQEMGSAPQERNVEWGSSPTVKEGPKKAWLNDSSLTIGLTPPDRALTTAVANISGRIGYFKTPANFNRARFN